MSDKHTLRHQLCSAAAIALMGAGTSAFAQTSGSSDAVEMVEIVVTARKSSEDILKTPVTISAMTSADLVARGVTSTQDIAAFTPGMKIVNNSSGRNDRSFQQVIVRGFTPSNSLAQTTSIFIDGVPVGSATAVSNITDPERVEVLKGPQSAYFGRQTFAGAMNIVTKAPPSEMEGSISGMAGTRNNYDMQASIGGPLLGDVLGFRASVRKYAKDGSYKNYGVPHQTLGDQSTQSGTLALTFKPTENFTMKAFGLLTENDDGPGAQGFIGAYQVTDASGKVIVANQSNCTLPGVTSAGVSRPAAYFCGTAPKLINSPSANTLNDSLIKNFLANPTGRIIDPADGAQGYGLVSRFYHLHLTMDYEIPDTGITLSSLTGSNHERYSLLSDLDNYYNTPTTPTSTTVRSYFDYPYLVERKNHDFSQEFRASYNNGGKLTGTFGVSYLNAFVQNALGGGNGAIGTTVFATAQGGSRSKTVGAFFGLGYKITDDLTINFDGRYQKDHLYAYAAPAGVTLRNDIFAPAGFYPGGSVLLDGKYKNFMPRVIVNYDINPDTMVYASYSKGINPGAFNTGFLTSTDAVQRAAAAAGMQIGAEPEELDNFEIGAKGKAFNNHVRYAVAAYNGLWTKQLNTQALALLDPTTNQPVLVQATVNSGKVRVQGIEGEVTAFVNRNLTLNASGSINDTKILSQVSPAITQLTGMTSFRGKQMALTSKYSAALGAQYSAPLPGHDDIEAFGRVDLSYKSGVYSNVANIVKTPDLTLVNVRTGLKTDKATFEGFVTNVFNTKSYTNIGDQYVFTSTFAYTSVNSALVVGLPELRTYGVRMRYEF